MALLLTFLIGMESCAGETTSIVSPQVEMQVNPQGIATKAPRFSWQIRSPLPNLVQQSYQIQVAGSEKDLKQGKNLIWDSGIVTSSESIQIPYEGQDLISGSEYSGE